MKKNILWRSILFLFVCVISYFTYHPLVYQFDYFPALGITGRHLYTDVVKAQGQPDSVTQQDDGSWIVQYDGLQFNFDKMDSAFRNAVITGSQYRFGLWKIGVGTSRRKIERVYQYITPIKDLDEDEYGIIEFDSWVTFVFDSNDNVEKIYLCYGP